jgi:hypothetical protein
LYTILLESRDGRRGWTLTRKPWWRPLPYEDEFTRLRWTTNWPGGYGQISFRLRRPLRYEYPDIGYMNRVRVFHGTQLVYDGQLWTLTQGFVGGEEYLDVIGFGHSGVLTSEPFNRIYGDTRFEQWFSDEVVTTNKPEKYSIDNNNRLMIALRRDVAYDNTFQAIWLWDMPSGFNDDIERIEYDYDVVIPGSGSFKAQLLAHSNQARTADQAILVDITATGAATGQSHNLVTPRKFLSWRFYNDSGTPNTPTDDDGVNFAKLTNVTVKTTTNAAINADEIAKDVLALYDDAQHGLDTSQDDIGAPALDLDPIWFDNGMTGDVVMDMITRMGGSSGEQWGWGIWEDKKLLMEARDLATPRYVVDAMDLVEAQTSGDLTPAFQRATPVYVNSRGRLVRGTTRDIYADVTSTDDPFNGRYRVREVDAYFTSDPNRAQSFADLWLLRNGRPVQRSRFVIQGREIADVHGKMIPLSHVRADGMLLVRNYRAHEAEAAGGSDIRDFRMIDDLSHTEYDVDTERLTLTPGYPAPTVSAQIAALKRQIGPASGWLQRQFGGKAGA